MFRCVRTDGHFKKEIQKKMLSRIKVRAENKYSKQHFFFDFLDFGDTIAHWYKSTYDKSEGENKREKSSQASA